MDQIKRIANFFQSDKGHQALLTALGIVLALGSFLLGRLSLAGDVHQNVVVTSTVTQDSKQEQDAYVPPASDGSLSNRQTATAASAPIAVLGKYVASKSGSAYHFPWCSGAKRIKEENKVYFNSKEEAEKAGYHPAGNCKGL